MDHEGILRALFTIFEAEQRRFTLGYYDQDGVEVRSHHSDRAMIGPEGAHLLRSENLTRLVELWRALPVKDHAYLLRQLVAVFAPDSSYHAVEPLALAFLLHAGLAAEAVEALDVYLQPEPAGVRAVEWLSLALKFEPQLFDEAALRRVEALGQGWLWEMRRGQRGDEGRRPEMATLEAIQAHRQRMRLHETFRLILEQVQLIRYHRLREELRRLEEETG
ncbi:MAG: hypothetical protein HYV08_16820 [Deltaproteobacteria bacterium]|nr:hypothetical protein [Deltaproteobacteria bacterium]